MLDAQAPGVQREVMLVIDHSGSRAGPKLEPARAVFRRSACDRPEFDP